MHLSEERHQNSTRILKKIVNFLVLVHNLVGENPKVMGDFHPRSLPNAAPSIAVLFNLSVDFNDSNTVTWDIEFSIQCFILS